MLGDPIAVGVVSMGAAVKEPVRRVVSPIFFILAGLCFLLPFAGVSCNTAALRSEASIGQELGGSASSSSQALNACLDGLSNVNLVTYSGVNLVAGSSPTVVTAVPPSCSAFSQANGGSVSTSPGAGSQANLGIQWLLLIALAAMLVGLLLSLGRFAVRGLAVAACAAVAVTLLLVNQAQVSSEFLAKLDQGSTSAALFNNYFNVNVGIGAILAIVALALVILYELAAGLATLVAAGSRAGPVAAYPNGPGVPPAPPPGGYGWPPSPPWGVPDAPPPPPPAPPES
ncbi:MAG: hypothetical protein ABSA40_06950 [Candidatus Dormibacteria bacterium]